MYGMAIVVHELKTWPEYFEAMLSGEKTFEFRKDDRGFEVGHQVYLFEWNPLIQAATGRELPPMEITYILRNRPDIGLPNGYCILQLKKVT